MGTRNTSLCCVAAASLGEEWQRRNECMAEKIVSYAKQYQSKRIVVVVGAEHRHMLRDLLKSQSGLICREYWEL